MNPTDEDPVWNRRSVGIGFLVCGIVLILGVNLWYYRGRLASSAVANAYYYDLGTGTLFTAPAQQLLPIPAPSDSKSSGAQSAQSAKSGVLAYVFSCGKCEDSSSRVVGWLQTYDPQAVEAILKRFGGNPPSNDYILTTLTESGGVMIREPAPEAKWVRVDSNHAQKMMQAARAQCGDPQSITQCQPR